MRLGIRNSFDVGDRRPHPELASTPPSPDWALETIVSQHEWI